MNKLVVITLTLLFFQLQLAAQTAPGIEADFEKNAILINGILLPKSATIQEYEKVLGKAERIIKVAGKDRIFVYDSFGISLSLAEDSDTVLDISLTYVPDGSKRQANGVFEGELLINGSPINTRTTPEDIANIANIELVEAMKDAYMGEGESLKLVVYYHEAGIRLIGFSY